MRQQASKFAVRPDSEADQPDVSYGISPLREGVYQFNYRMAASGDYSKGRGLAILRGGSVLGSDEWGGVFSGTYRLLETEALHQVSVTFSLPAQGELVSGHRAGANRLELKMDSKFQTPDPQALAIVHVEGVPVGVELVYIGPVPTT